MLFRSRNTRGMRVVNVAVRESSPKYEDWPSIVEVSSDKEKYKEFYGMKLDAKTDATMENELEITDLIETYMLDGCLDVNFLGRGSAWFDAGTPERMFMVSDYVRILQERGGEVVGSPEEVALRMELISHSNFATLVAKMPESNYKHQLLEIDLQQISGVGQ